MPRVPESANNFLPSTDTQTRTHHDVPLYIADYHPFELMFIENHISGLKANAALAVDAYNAEKGLLLVPTLDYQEFTDQKTLTAKQVHTARQLGARALLSDKVNKVVITIFDSDTIPENDRNAPSLGGKPALNPEASPMFQIHPKKETGDAGDQYYDFEPLSLDIIIKYIDEAQQFLKFKMNAREQKAVTKVDKRVRRQQRKVARKSNRNKTKSRKK